MNKVPFSLPAKCPDEIENLLSSVNSGMVVGDGPYTKAAQQLLSEQLSSKGEVLLTTSCTHALEMAAILLEIRLGDEVIVPSYTFVSSALSFHMRGAKIVFADIKSDTLNIDVSVVERLITNRTRAIVAVHYGGVACDMDALIELAARHDIDVIEDNAHGLYGKYRDQYLGSIGSIATQSFHGTKNLSCGEGGALIVNKEKLFDRAKIIREKGTNRSQFLEGKVDKYTWVDEGSSYVMSDILASLLYSQLNHAGRIQQKRKRIWDTYERELSSWATDFNIATPFIPSHCSQSYHLFYLLFPNQSNRDHFISFMSERGVETASHYQPLHSSSYALRFTDSSAQDCPVTTQISNTIVRLPLFADMSEEQQDYVLESAQEYGC